MKELQKQIGERLRDWRKKELQKDSKTVAAMCNLSAPMYSQIENGERGPSVVTLSDIHTATGINLHWLLTGNNS